jgi:pimeloyl-ACP methyl ester carboxylesterase
MRLILSLVFMFVAFSPVAYADTSVSGILSGSAVWTKENSPYVVNNTFTVNTGATLIIEPGVVVKMSPNYFFYVYGTLQAQGSSTDSIIFTSIKDDSVGGDTNGDGDMSTPVPGDWLPLNFLYASKGQLSNVNFRYGGHASGAQFNTGQIMTDGAELLISHSQFASTSNYHIQQFSGSTTITASEFFVAPVGIRIHGGTIDVSQSSFSDIQALGIFATPTLSPVNTKAQHNWWGNASGPTDSAGNPSGTGVGISSNTTYVPWLGYDPLHDTPPSPGCTENCNSSVMFLPGFEASRLYMPTICNPDGCDLRLWESSSDPLIEQLFLDQNGQSANSEIYTKDVIDQAYDVVDIYDGFINEMNQMVTSGLIHEWEAIPYDWRLSADTLLQRGKKYPDGHISYLEATSSPYILQEFKRLAQNSRTGKVTIVAHSNGGIVTKALMQKLETLGIANLVDKIIFVAVPQTGTPQAIGAFLHGADQGIPVLFKASTVRTFGENMPGAYQLLPSYAYFTSDGSGAIEPVVTFDSSSSQTGIFRNIFGNEITSKGALDAFLLGYDGRPKPDADNLTYPNILNTNLLAGAAVKHDSYDTWIAPTTTQVYQIAGWGVDTMKAIKYVQGGFFHCLGVDPCLDYEPVPTEDGDGTVVVSSALAMSTSTENVRRYWVDLSEYNDQNTNRDHKDILEVTNLLDFIKDTLTSTTKSLTEYTYLFSQTPTNNSGKRLRYYLHSPLTLSVYDTQGRFTGVSSTTGQIVHGIPGAYYKEFGDVKYLSVLASSSPTLVMHGEATGGFTLKIEEVQGSDIIGTTTFADIPSSTSTQITMDFTDGTIGGASPLRVDEDGNGTTDITLTSKLNDTVTYTPVIPGTPDTTAPTTTVTTTGTLGKNAWYISNVTVVLTATDTESGVASTTYSLDNGTTWLLYTAPVTIANEGTTTLFYRSVDKAGNIEATSTLTLKIDKTAPEASVTFDPSIQKLKVIGIDNLSSTTASSMASSSIITDEAGHTLKVVFSDLKPKAKPGRINIAITGLVYDGATTTLASTTLRYK